MKASYRTRYGPPEVIFISEQPPPKPGPGELLIRVRATTVSRTDHAGLSGTPWIFRLFTGLRRPKYTATGTDFAGEVLAVGPGVTNFAVGMRVWGFNDELAGSHAQEFIFPENMAVVPIPDGVSYEDAAASAEGPHYALSLIDKANVCSGCHVLVNGATGGIGSAAVQLLKLRGAIVTAVCAGENAELAAGLGADRVIDYRSFDFTESDDLYDVIIDAVGKSSFGGCKRVLKPSGVYISSEPGPGAINLVLALATSCSGGKKVKFPLPGDIRSSLMLMSSLLADKKYKPLIDRRYPLESIREAFYYVAEGRKLGNVVLVMD